MPLPKVLVVDDDEAIRNLLLAALRRQPLEVDGASDGRVALDLISTNDYAVMLVDLMMPRLNGFEFLEAYRARHPNRRPVVFVMTAFDDLTFPRLDTSLVHGVLRKPFDVEQLIELIRDCAGIIQELAPVELLRPPDDVQLQ